MLLMLNDDGGFVNVPPASLNHALAGGVLMDLALENRIDTDLQQLLLLDSTPVGDSLLDSTLADIGALSDRSTRFWVERTAQRADEIREDALSRLVAAGILERRDDRVLWVFRSRRYPVVQGEAEREVKLRIMGVLFSNEIPDPRDVVIICLADASGLFRQMLSRQEVDRVSDRIQQVRRLDLIGQAVSQVLSDFEKSVAIMIQRHF
jgi:hypothetical protein